MAVTDSSKPPDGSYRFVHTTSWQLPICPNQQMVATDLSKPADGSYRFNRKNMITFFANDYDLVLLYTCVCVCICITCQSSVIFRNVCSLLWQEWLHSVTLILLVRWVNPVWRTSDSAVCHIRVGHGPIGTHYWASNDPCCGLNDFHRGRQAFLLNQRAVSPYSDNNHRRDTVGLRRTGAMQPYGQPV